MTDEQIEAVLGDFRRWLREHGDKEPAFDPVALVEEFTALRHEVKLLTKAVRARNEDGESAPADDLRPLVTAAIEMVDAVDRGVEAASRLAAGRGGWRRLFRGGKQVAALAEGLKLARNRVAASLARLGVEPVEAPGRPFDPETMEAVDVAAGTGRPSGIVVEELRAGYRWRGKVFRYAQVRVAK